MATGYTQSISEGISFKDFTLNCARAFGALISMRDEPNGTPIPTEIKPSNYNLNALKKVTADLKKYKAMPIKDAKEFCKKEYEAEIEQIAKRKKKNLGLKNKYQLMLNKVEKWTPPTIEHEGLKKFMIEQIESSIKWDCNYEQKFPKKQNAKEWLIKHKLQAISDIDYHTKGNIKEIERCNERTKWIQDLIKSLT